MNPFIKDSFVLPCVSLNKLRVMSLEGIETPEHIQGKTGMDLVSASFFYKEVNAITKGLNTQDERVSAFKGLLNAADKDASTEADAIVKRLAENLAYLLFALKKTKASCKQQRKDWDDIHWEYWQSVNNIYLSGGLTFGVMGERLKLYTESFFDGAGYRPFNLHLTKNSEYLPLIGAYGVGHSQSENILVFDFGHTYVKRGYGTGDTLFILESVPTLTKMEESFSEEQREESVNLHKFIKNVVLNTLENADGIKIDTDNIVISIANYIYKGSIYLNRGVYGKLRLLSDRYQDLLTKEICQALGKTVSVTLMHDGTAAAAAINDSNGVVITLGTGLGVGFCSTYKFPKTTYILKKI